MSDTAGSMRDRAGSRDGGSVDQLLLEAGLNDDAGLRSALLELRALSAGQPVPSDAVAALMVPGAYTPGAIGAEALHSAAPQAAASQAVAPQGVAAPPADELAARRRARRRITLTTLSVAVSLAAGGAVAAASDQGIRDTFGQLNHAVSSFVAGSGGEASEKPAKTQVTDSAQLGGAASVPAPSGPALSGPVGAGTGQAGEAAAPASGAASGREGIPAPSSPAFVPPSAITLPQDLAPGLPGADDPNAGTPLNDGPLGGDAPSLTEPLPLPGTPAAGK